MLHCLDIGTKPVPTQESTSTLTGEKTTHSFLDPNFDHGSSRSDKEEIHTSDSDGEDIPALSNRVLVKSSDESAEANRGRCRNNSFDSSSDSDGEGPPGLTDRPVLSSDESSENEKCHPRCKSSNNSVGQDR